VHRTCPSSRPWPDRPEPQLVQRIWRRALRRNWYLLVTTRARGRFASLQFERLEAHGACSQRVISAINLSSPCLPRISSASLRVVPTTNRSLTALLPTPWNFELARHRLRRTGIRVDTPKTIRARVRSPADHSRSTRSNSANSIRDRRGYARGDAVLYSAPTQLQRI
jgi:hypothetical protein